MLHHRSCELNWFYQPNLKNCFYPVFTLNSLSWNYIQLVMSFPQGCSAFYVACWWHFPVRVTGQNNPIMGFKVSQLSGKTKTALYNAWHPLAVHSPTSLLWFPLLILIQYIHVWEAFIKEKPFTKIIPPTDLAWNFTAQKKNPYKNILSSFHVRTSSYTPVKLWSSIGEWEIVLNSK